MAEGEDKLTDEQLADMVEKLQAENAQLRTSLETAEAKRKSLNKSLDDHKSRWDGISPDEARAAIEFQHSFDGKDADARFAEFQKVTEAKFRSQLDRDKGQMRQAHEASESEWKTERAAMMRQLETWGRDAQVRQFMANKGNADLGVRLAAAETKLTQMPDGSYDFVVINNNGDPRVDSLGNPLLLSAHMETWVDDPVYKSLFSGHGVQGGSTPAGSSKVGTGSSADDVAKAFDPENPNLTAIMELFRSDPARARALAAQNGVSIPENVQAHG